jgi:hypothetical protein
MYQSQQNKQVLKAGRGEYPHTWAELQPTDKMTGQGEEGIYGSCDWNI